MSTPKPPIGDTRPADCLRVLGFDYGELRIGVAAGQTITATAEPLETLKNRERHAPDWTAIGQLIERWRPDLLLVGVPRRDDGGEYEVTPRAQRFGRRLNGRFQLPVLEVDERLSSWEAQERLGTRHAGPIDAMAAAVIVETWLDARRRVTD
ncbi:MAG: Holliday junction resolvase RuvX [Pseudomonadota bacterium]